MQIKLTQSFINSASCPPDKLRIEYCDTDLPGLYLLASATGNTLSYYLRYKDSNGKTCHHKIGRASDRHPGERIRVRQPDLCRD